MKRYELQDVRFFHSLGEAEQRNALEAIALHLSHADAGALNQAIINAQRSKHTSVREYAKTLLEKCAAFLTAGDLKQREKEARYGTPQGNIPFGTVPRSPRRDRGGSYHRPLTPTTFSHDL